MASTKLDPTVEQPRMMPTSSFLLRKLDKSRFQLACLIYEHVFVFINCMNVFRHCRANHRIEGMAWNLASVLPNYLLASCVWSFLLFRVLLSWFMAFSHHARQGPVHLQASPGTKSQYRDN